MIFFFYLEYAYVSCQRKKEKKEKWDILPNFSFLSPEGSMFPDSGGLGGCMGSRFLRFDRYFVIYSLFLSDLYMLFFLAV